MGRRIFAAAGAALLGTMLAAPAVAQFGIIFGDPPPRPPGSVPGGRQQVPAPPPQPAPPPDYNPPPSAPPPARGPAPGGVQSQPLPPPPSASIEPRAPGPVERSPVESLPPAQRQPRGTPQPAASPPPAVSPPADEAIVEPPAQKIANTAALFTGLDKITGRIINFDVAIGETVQFGALQLTPRACYTRPATESTNTDAFVEVDEVTLKGEVRRIFTGWMFAASPGMHAVEHPIYDIWLTDCKGGAVTAEKPADPPPQPAAAPARTQPQRQQPTRPQQRPTQALPAIR